MESLMELQHYPVVEYDIAHDDTEEGERERESSRISL